MTRPDVLVCLLLCIAPVTLAGDAGSEISKSIGELPFETGARGKVLTVLAGNEILEIPLNYLGTYENFGGPGYDLHLVELSGEEAEHVGIANGMSGSPVYIDGELIGALAFRLGAIPKKPVAGVTPIENMRDVVRSNGPTAAPVAGGLEPISTPVLVGGMPDDVREWFAAGIEEMGFVVVAGGAGGAGNAVASGGARGGELRAGSPVGVELVRGDTRIAATGTVTLVEEDRVYAFGHPFLGVGRIEMPMVSASVIHTLADMAGSVKLSNVGDEVGAIIEDRLGGVVGRLGHSAKMVPVDVTVRGADYGDQSFHYEMVRHPRLSPLLAGSVVATSLRTVGYSAEMTMLAHGRVRLEGLPDVPIDGAFASSTGTDPGLAIASELLSVLSALGANPFEELPIDGIEIEIDASLEPVSYTVEDVHYDRGSLAPGEPLLVRCVLKRYRGETEVREIEIPLPDSLPVRNGLALVVGSPETVNRALGDTIAERMRSAKDLRSMIEILEDRRAASRLTAVVYRPGGALIARGAEYAELPPTAERLLATQGGARAQRGAPLVSPIARAEVELDGPVRGGRRIRLRIDRSAGVGGNE